VNNSKLIVLLLVLISCSKQNIGTAELSVTLGDYFADKDVDYHKTKKRAIWPTPSIYPSNKIVLTFDDGPGPYTNKLLDIFAEYNKDRPEGQKAFATFFVLGENLSKYPEVAKRIIEDGHILASHDWNHTNNNKENQTLFESDLAKSIVAVEEVYASLGIERKEIYFRFPYGEYGKNGGYHHLDSIKKVGDKLYGENCLNYAFWDYDTNDWVKKMTSEMIALNTFNMLPAVKEMILYDRMKKDGIWTPIKVEIDASYKHGGVSLMHDVHLRSVLATKILLDKIETHNSTSRDEDKIEVVALDTVTEYQYDERECTLVD